MMFFFSQWLWKVNIVYYTFSEDNCCICLNLKIVFLEIQWGYKSHEVNESIKVTRTTYKSHYKR